MMYIKNLVHSEFCCTPDLKMMRLTQTLLSEMTLRELELLKIQQHSREVFLNPLGSSALVGLKLESLTGGNVTDTDFTVDTPVYQTIGVGSTAVGYVASWD